MKKKALITGISGFVGPYLKLELERNNYRVFGLDRKAEGDKTIFSCDLLDKSAVLKIIDLIKPNFIFHLAGFSSVHKSWKEPKLCRKINVEGTKNVLDAIVRVGIKPKILIVSSAEVYGNPKELPVKETSLLNPQNPYAKSRLEQERLLENYKNLDWVISRSFNHTGPGQLPPFVIPEFAKQLSEIKRGLKEPVIKVGNLSARRDYSDVRDVVEAYRLLLEHGKVHEAYNVCSGRSRQIEALLKIMIKIIKKNVKIEKDKTKSRPVDIKRLSGDNKKISEIGFTLKYDINETLKEILQWWEHRV